MEVVQEPKSKFVSTLRKTINLTRKEVLDTAMKAKYNKLQKQWEAYNEARERKTNDNVAVGEKRKCV